jgi:MFS transporter, FSR family, fosmidomycin resistance protein
MSILAAAPATSRRVAERAALSILVALGFSHFLNDMMQSLVPALYPMLKGAYGLSFAEIGMIALTMQLTSSFLQPVVGLGADRRPQPYSLAVGMGATLFGLLLLAHAGNYGLLLLAAALVGIGSAVFHPEASRVTCRWRRRRSTSSSFCLRSRSGPWSAARSATGSAAKPCCGARSSACCRSP